MEWMLGTSQPFTAVDDIYFRRLIAYLNRVAESEMLRADAIRDRIMDYSKQLREKAIEIIMVSARSTLR